MFYIKLKEILDIHVNLINLRFLGNTDRVSDDGFEVKSSVFVNKPRVAWLQIFKQLGQASFWRWLEIVT